MDVTGLDLEIHIDEMGKTSWNFLTFDKNSLSSCSRIDYLPSKGYGMMSRKKYSTGDLILNECSLACIPTGQYANRVCFECLSSPLHKVKVEEEYPFISYCSIDCMTKNSTYMQRFGPILTYLESLRRSDMHIFSLALRLIYKYYIQKESPALYDQYLKLSYHDANNDLGFDNIINELYFKYNFDVVDKLELKKLCLIIMYNSQSFTINKLPNTQLFSLLLCSSRINHCCVPNVLLTQVVQNDIDNDNTGQRGSSSSRRGRLTVYIIAIRPIQTDEEITM
jgi:hypothetical protein